MEKLLTIKEVAELLRVNHRTVRKVIARGDLKACKMSSGRSKLLFRPSDVEAFVASRIVDPTKAE